MTLLHPVATMYENSPKEPALSRHFRVNINSYVLHHLQEGYASSKASLQQTNLK
jgi:hypothetical protein